jgi:hypothetical protein
MAELTTGTERLMSTGELAGRGRAIGGESEHGIGRKVLGTAVYVLRQLAGCLAAIVVVWLAVMLFRHAQAAALGLAVVILAGAGTTLFMRDRSLRQ